MEKLDPQKYAEAISMELHIPDVQYGVTNLMIANYLQDEHNMPRSVALAVAVYLDTIWDEVAEERVKQGDLINDRIKEWVR